MDLSPEAARPPFFSPAPVQVRRAGPNDLDLVVDILADAFQDDPVVLWLSDHPDFPGFNFRVVIEAFIADQGILIDESGSAAALFLPPGKKMASLVSPMVALKGLWHFGSGPLIRALRLLSLFEKHHYQADHLYIFAIGNRPAVRGRGYGSAVMKAVLSLGGGAEYPTYLENSKAANFAFYHKFGFESQTRLCLPQKGPDVTTMLRPAGHHWA
ncbi:MAG: GNAT family N-acetyltransferase [Hahellaceae bacterium]|nr:GNAT family N-acetyltransferase [Hahellaceae bacterium]